MPEASNKLKAARLKEMLAGVDLTTLRELESVLATFTFPVLLNFSQVREEDVVELNGGKQRLGRGLYAQLPLAHPNNEKLNQQAAQEFLQQGQKAEPEWDREAGFWSLTRNALGTHLINAVERYGACWIAQVYDEKEVCAYACQHARGDDCKCSCGGENHGCGDDGSWHHITEIYAVRAGPYIFAIRLQESSVSPEELARRAAQKRQSVKSRKQLREEAAAAEEAAYREAAAKIADEVKTRAEAQRAAIFAKWERIEAEATARALARTLTAQPVPLPTGRFEQMQVRKTEATLARAVRKATWDAPVKSAAKGAFADPDVLAAFFDDLKN